ncbi:3',5'-nucleoside bisphosphate phosphatase [Rhodocyclaceae bacterium SMB388]
MNADLHCHSTVSDGWLSPGEVVARAAANGVTLLALTDHDELGGVDEAIAAAKRLRLRFVAGVEISVSCFGETIHVVGLGVDHHDSELVEGLAGIRRGRAARARRIGEALAAVGIRDALEGARGFAGNPDLVGRAHFARHLVHIGLMPDVNTVFRYYLAKGKPGYIEHEWASMDDALRWIRGAGGIAVLAHPARYRLSEQQMGTMLDRFVAGGGEGIEVVSGAHTHDEMLKFASVARRRGLLASRASDFHGADESPVDLGRCSPLPPDLVPVWTRLC